MENNLRFKSDEMRSMALILICVALAGCGRPAKSKPPLTAPSMIRVPDAKCVFALSEGWSRMSDKSQYVSRGFSAAFQKGEDPAIPSSYFLFQVTQQKKWPAKNLQSLADKAVPLESIRDLTGYISTGKHKSKPELYNAQHDIYVIVQEYEDSGKQSTTVMIKRFLAEHYVVLHFYLRDNLEADVGVIADTLKSIKYDEDE